MDDNDVRSGQGKGDDLLSINIDRNQPKTGQPLRNFPPGKQEPSSGSYQNPATKTFLNYKVRLQYPQPVS